MQEQIIGPILFLDDIGARKMHLAALFLCPPGTGPGPVTAEGMVHMPDCLREADYGSVWRCRFVLPADRATGYAWNGQTFELAGDLSGALRLGYASCNGEENGDLERDPAERNAMWARLLHRHRTAPFHLLLHGGDQIYADETTRGHALSADWPRSVPDRPKDAELRDLRRHLRRKFHDRYVAIYGDPSFAALAARVPSLTMWDDHDICDGWGSLRPAVAGSPVGRTLFAVAREAYLLYQNAARDGDLPARFADAQGRHLGWTVQAEGLRIVAPDLRSERTRHQVMGPSGWAMMEALAKAPAPERTLLMSSVPLLGPRLSLLERGVLWIPRLRKYEDDLRDQWQSRAHRAEWQRMLSLVRDMVRTTGTTLTALSGEIHLATRATMTLDAQRRVHQLVASGIAHRAPPRTWARVLGWLAMMGEDPLPDAPIRIHALPGQRGRYVAERNALWLDRAANGAWSARWDLEQSGPTAPLAI